MDLFIKVGVDDQASSGISKLSNSVKTGLTGVATMATAAVAGATTAVVALTKQAVSEFAEYEQLVGGVEAMFGGIENGADQINSVLATADGAWQTLTMSQNDYFSAFTSTYPLIKSSIADENEAIATTNRMLTLESDLANTFGYSMETASTAVNWALKGSFNYIDNLNIGIKGTAEGFLEAAQSCGYMVKDVKELTSDQILDVLEQYADKYGVLGRTAEEAGHTIQGSTKMLKSAWQNLLTSLSGGTEEFTLSFSKAMDDMMVAIFGNGDSVEGILALVQPVVENVIDNIGVMITSLAPRLADQIPAVISSILPALISGAVTLVNAVAGTLPLIISVITEFAPQIMDAGLQIVTALGEGILQNIDAIVNAVTQIIVMFVQFIGEHAEEVTSGAIQIIIALVNGLISALPQLIEATPQIIEGIVQGIIANLPAIITAGVQLIQALVEGLISAATLTVEAMQTIGVQIYNGIKATIDSASTWGADLISNFISGIRSKISGLAGAVGEAASTIASYIHFTEPDIGPLSNFHTYAPDMMKTFAEGIKDNGYLIGDAFNSTLGFETGSLSMATSNPSAGNMVINLTTTLDGAVIARNQYKYNQRESRLHGASLVNA